MQIAINVNDATVASKILTYLKKFNQEEVTFEMLEDASLDIYQHTQQFQKDRDALHQTLEDIISGKAKLSTVDDKFWNKMDEVIANA